MERKIGEIFPYNGEWHQCLEGTGCHKCDFNIDENTCGIENPYCINRSDKKDVIFKKLEKVGEPYNAKNRSTGRTIYFQRYRCYQKPIIEGNIIWHWVDDTLIDIEIKQKQEDMEEKYKAEDTPLTRLVGRYVNNLIDYNVFEKAVKELYSNKEENKPLLKEFDLEAAKAGKPVCTRDGRKARIICFDANDSNNQPIIALITEENGFESLYSFTSGGKWVKEDSVHDLMMLPEKKEGWIVIHKEAIYDKETAEKIARETTSNVIRIQKIEWEE